MPCRPRALLLALLIAAGLAACQPQPEVTPTLALTEIEELPESESLEDIPPTNEIAGGLECLFVPMDSTAVIGDKRLNFTCMESGGAGTALIGDIQATDQAWAIERVDYITDGVTYTAQNSRLALINRIILEDESDCAFSGPIVEGNVAGQRLSFTCGPKDDFTIGLFGLPTPTEYGWEMLEAEYRVVDDAFEYWNAVKSVIVAVVIPLE